MSTSTVRRMFAIICLMPVSLWSADEVPLVELIDANTHQQESEAQNTSASMINVQGQTLAELIESQALENSTVEASDLSVHNLLEVNEIDLNQSVVNTISYEDERDPAAFQQQASQDSERNSCKKSDDEKTVCANIVCDYGVTRGEWSSACTKHKLDLMLLNIQTPPWEDIPKCTMVSEICNKIGRASTREVDNSFCDSISDLKKRHACFLGREIGEKESAAQYIERHQVDISTLESIEFEEVEEIQNTQDHSDSFLATYVDSRFANDDDLFQSNGDSIPAQILGAYLQNRHNSTAVASLRQRLIRSGVMQEQCADVDHHQFYNCNQFHDLPRQCWSAPNNESIVECVRESTH